LEEKSMSNREIIYQLAFSMAMLVYRAYWDLSFFITDITLEEPAGAEKPREAKVSGEGASAGTFTAQGLTSMRSGCNYEVLSDQKPILYPPMDP